MFFQWQILEWNIPTEILQQMGIHLQPAGSIAKSTSSGAKDALKETPPPTFQPWVGTKTKKFRATKFADHAGADARNRKLGLAGELLVLAHEKQVLMNAGRTELVTRVRHIADIEGDGAGYDILSTVEDGSPKYIEVKTTKGSPETSFYMSSNEVEFSKRNPEHFYLYRVYDYDEERNSGKFYIVRGSTEESFNLMPANYRVSRT